MSFEQQHNPYGRVCANCSRSISGGIPYYYSGPYAFCSPMCSDVSRVWLAKSVCPDCKQETPHDEYHDCPADEHAQAESREGRMRMLRDGQCDLGASCFVCSGAIRSRAGKGDNT